MPKAQDYSPQHKRKNSLFYAVATVGLIVLPIVLIVASWVRRNAAEAQSEAAEAAIVSYCRAYLTAQEQFKHSFGSNVEYAKRLSGANSLFETQAGFYDRKLIPKPMADAEAYPGLAEPIQGYVFKVLLGRATKEAPFKQGYVDSSGKLNLGHALLALPVKYSSESKFVYMVGMDGAIYQKDFGPQTPFVVQNLTLYNPDASWKKLF